MTRALLPWVQYAIYNEPLQMWCVHQVRNSRKTMLKMAISRSVHYSLLSCHMIQSILFLESMGHFKVFRQALHVHVAK